MRHSHRAVFTVLAAAGLFAALSCEAQQAPKPDSQEPLVWIDPANPYSSYLEAAVLSKHTPVEFTTRKDKATETASLTATSRKGSAARAVFLGPLNSGSRTNLSLSISDVTTGAIIFAYSCVKNGEGHGFQSAAECLAKHWKDSLKKKD